jgi:PAS domain S-box-containing protein
MMEFLKKLFASDLMAHGYCYLWRPEIVWLHVVSDTLITLAYYSIPVTLVYFVRKRRDLPFHWMFLMFGAFILGCGTTHVMEVWTIWHGTYRLAGIIKLITAGLSVSTAVALVPLMPKALALPSPALLEAANHELEQEVCNRQLAEEEIKRLNESLERRVHERTAQLEAANQELQNEIAERKRTQEALGESEARKRAILESALDGIISVDHEGRIVEFNPAAEKAFGYSRDDVLDKRLAEMIISPSWRDRMAHYLTTGEGPVIGKRIEMPAMRADGTEFPTELAVTRVDVGGSPMFTTHFRDISDRKRADEKFRLAVESAPNAMVMVNQEGKIVLVNSQTEKLFGYQRDELIAQSVDILVPNEFREAHPQHRAGFFAHPQARAMGAGRELYARRKDGLEFPVEIGLNPIEMDEGTWVLSAIVDITERKRAEEERKQFEDQIQQAQKLESLGVLAGGIAHDFNNLLTGILGNASLAYDSLSPSNPNRPRLDDVIKAAERAADLTSQLLAYAGKGRFITTLVNLPELVKEISSLIQAAVPHNVQLRLELEPGLPSIEADSGQLQQVVMNLVINGAEAIGEQAGMVLVTTYLQNVEEHDILTVWGNNELLPGKYVALKVQDTGCGMDQATISKIFDPFFTTKFTGRGLGLAAVMGIVRGHQGALKVYSSPGQGTTFKVLFPIAAAAKRQEAEERADAVAAAHGRETILVVDDEEIVRLTAQNSLERYGYKVLHASDGREAIELFRGQPDRIALVLLDLTMPVMSGEETLRQLKSLKPTVKVLLSSGHTEVEAVRHFAGKGLAGFIQKPYAALNLVQRVRSVLDNFRG